MTAFRQSWSKVCPTLHYKLKSFFNLPKGINRGIPLLVDPIQIEHMYKNSASPSVRIFHITLLVS